MLNAQWPYAYAGCVLPETSGSGVLVGPTLTVWFSYLPSLRGYGFPVSAWGHSNMPHQDCTAGLTQYAGASQQHGGQGLGMPKRTRLVDVSITAESYCVSGDAQCRDQQERHIAVSTGAPFVKVTSPMIFTPGTNLTGPFTMRLFASIRLGMPSVSDCVGATQRGWGHT